MRIRVTGIKNIADLASDCVSVAARAEVGLPAIVQRNAEAGNRLAQSVARAQAGPHGALYYKRITAEAISPLSWEYGPSAPIGRYTGVSGAAGAMRDLNKSARKQGPAMASDGRDFAAALFWT